MDQGRHEGEGPPDGFGSDVEQRGERKHERKHRRVTTEPVPGSDPTPQPEPLRHSDAENDERLKADKPPHWG